MQIASSHIRFPVCAQLHVCEADKTIYEAEIFLLKPVQCEILSTKALFFQTILKHCPTAKVTFWHVTRAYALFTLARNTNTIYLYMFVDISSC
jgi:hypothetical protein